MDDSWTDEYPMGMYGLRKVAETQEDDSKGREMGDHTGAALTNSSFLSLEAAHASHSAHTTHTTHWWACGLLFRSIDNRDFSCSEK